jgi:hypothetical protein
MVIDMTRIVPLNELDNEERKNKDAELIVKVLQILKTDG